MAIHGTGDGTTKADFGVFIPELWASAVLRYFEKKLVFRPFFDDYSSLVKGKGDKINIPEITQVGTGTKGAETPVSYTSNLETDMSIDVGTHLYAAKLFEDIAVIQANESLFSKYAQSMAYSLAKEVDTAIEANMQSFQTSVSLSANNTLTNAKAEEIYATLLGLDVPTEQCAWFLNPTLYADVVANHSFVSAGGATDAQMGFNGRNGVVGSLYGIPVVMSNQIDSSSGTGIKQGYLCHSSAVGVAVQQEIRVQSDYSIDNLGTRVVADVIFGSATLDHANHKKGIRLAGTA